MAIDLAGVGFVVDEWYWKISENDRAFGGQAAVRDFLAPLARLARDRFVLDEISADADDRGVRFRLADQPVEIRLPDERDRASVARFVTEVNRSLAQAKLGVAFALVVPRRYELRGVLLTDDELATLGADPVVMAPLARGSQRTIA